MRRNVRSSRPVVPISPLGGRELPAFSRLEDQIGVILYKHFGSKNPSYPTNSWEAGKMVLCADELAKFIRSSNLRILKRLTSHENKCNGGLRNGR